MDVDNPLLIGRTIEDFVAGGPATAERRFFASVVVEELAGLGARADLLAVVLPTPDVRVLLVVVGLTTGLGLNELTEVVGFRVVEVDDELLARFSASVSVLGARDVLRAAAASGFFFSSPEPPTEGCERWLELEDVGAVALLAGFRAPVEIDARVGGLERPPVAMRLEDEAVGFVPVAVAEVAGRFTRPRLGGIFSFVPLSFVPFSFAEDTFSVSVSTSDVRPGVSSPDWMSISEAEGTSSCCKTSGV